MFASLRDEAICSICLELFTCPISLSCMHMFCYDCMQRWLQQMKDLTLICPVCRGVNEKPPSEEWQVSVLSFVIKQHRFLLDQTLCVTEKFLKFQEDMTLDTVTANSRLVLSEDLRKVHCGKICRKSMGDPQRFDAMACVLGTPCFSSGRHYWEVEVEEGKEWALGVCKESVDRKKSSFSSEHGFWTISMKAGAIYSSSVPNTRIPANPGLSRVGIFLDVELEEIKFFDVRNDALIYICNEVSSEPLRPFFCVGLPGEEDSGGSLSICS
ncbi:ret finger protein-like 4B [Glossophaga mutica]